MRFLLSFSSAIDGVNEKIGNVCNWLVLLACIVSGGNAMVRYAYDMSSNAWLEVQWYRFAVIPGRAIRRRPDQDQERPPGAV